VPGVLGCARLCSVVLGCARLCSVVLGCARLCSVVLGCARDAHKLGSSLREIDRAEFTRGTNEVSKTRDDARINHQKTPGQF
jgi:hypothetical protein